MANLNQVLIADILAGRNPYQRPVDPYAPAASGFTPSAPQPTRQVNAGQTFGAEQEALRAQNRRAALLSEQAARSPGLITAGRVSAPGANFGTALAQGMRGYMSGSEAGKANRLSKTLAAKEEAAAQAAAELDAAAVAEDARRDKRDAALAAAKEDRAAENELRDNLRADRQLQSENARLGIEKGKRVVVPYHDPDDPEATLNIKRDSGGNFYTIDNKPLPGEFVETLTEKVPSTTLGSKVNLPAAVETGILRNEGTTANIDDVITEIETLKANGESTSGAMRSLVNMVPQDWRGIAEDLAFSADEQKTSAKLTALDIQMMKAVNSDRLSDADARLLNGIRASIGGLKPEQQIGRLQAANEIMARYGMAITGEPEVADDDLAAMKAELAELEGANQ